jgi:ABC-type phosphate/phosphonate transport system ATPase subunit
MIQNQDLVLLIGRSASGKSATIHFLARSKMV